MNGSRPFGQALPHLRGRVPGRTSRRLAERLKAVESRDVTFMDDGWPVFWAEARGSNVRDADGNVFLDLTGAFGVALLGHGHPGVVEAVSRQADRLLHGMGDVHPPVAKVVFLERLAALLPWERSRAVLSSTGSEAVETALKTGQVATGRPGVLAFEGAYHGLTLGSLSATSRDHFRTTFQKRLYDGVAFVPFPDVLRSGVEDADRVLDEVERALDEGAPNGDAIGTVLVEPVQGRAGARVAPSGFMERLSRLARDREVVVVADEILTGAGRCGSFLASERVGLEPDVVCLGKALGGGMPLSVCAGRAEVMDAWPASSGEAVHTSTFLGHPLGCAAGEAVLQALEFEGVAERARMVGGRLMGALRTRLGERPDVGEVRGLGLLMGIEFVEPGERGPDCGRGVRIARHVLEEGVLVLPAGAGGEVLQLLPPMDLTDEQVDFAIEALVRAVEATA